MYSEDVVKIVGGKENNASDSRFGGKSPPE